MSEERRAKQTERIRAHSTPSVVRRLVLLLQKYWKKGLVVLGVSGLTDIGKEFVRGKLVDQVYLHLGSLGRWLMAYPVAFFTLSLCVIVVVLVVMEIRESLVVETSSIYNEEGELYERQTVSPKWTRWLVVTGIVCVCVIVYGTYRYYQISIGHFIVNQNTNVILPLLPMAPPPPVPDNPPTLVDIFKNDFPTIMRAINDLSLEGTKLQMKQQVYLDFLGKAKFVGFYIPMSSDPISGSQTYKVCMTLMDQVQPAMDDLAKHVPMEGGIAFDGNTIEELTFTGRVIIYHEDLLSITQRAEIINAYRNKHLDVQFRGSDYLMNQIAMWHQRHDSKQGH